MQETRNVHQLSVGCRHSQDSLVIHNVGLAIHRPQALSLEPPKQDPGFWIQDPGFRIQNPGSRIRDLGFRILDPGCRILDPGRDFFDLDLCSKVISGNGEPWPQRYGALVYTKLFEITSNVVNVFRAGSLEECI